MSFHTFEVRGTLLPPLDEDGLVVGLVALQLGVARRLVAHESLVALQHEHRTVDKVEKVPGVKKRLYINRVEKLAQSPRYLLSLLS